MARKLFDYPNAYSVMDVFVDHAQGLTQSVDGQPAFSVDGGKTDLDNFIINAQGDFGDWAASEGDDALLAFSSSGAANATADDVAALDVIGANTMTTSPATVVSSVATSDPGIGSGSGDLNAGEVVTLTVDMSQVVSLSLAAHHRSLLMMAK